MLNSLKKRNEGFTIIEVMIVLAIAGLIILIVLLAVPALQRNGRNTAIKNDVSALAAGVAEFGSNNDGTPVNGMSGSGTITISGASGTATTAKIQGSTTINAAASGVPAAGTPATGTITPYYGHKCDGTTSPRSVALFYTIESGSTLVQKCVEA